ncbi:MAG: response regulator transcription factor [Bacteroidota bacterium]|nr:response regulator transcription factor [Bacteroidota bacterium]
MKKIFIADDHPIFRKGLIEIISAEPGFEVVGECGDGITALKYIAEKKPDIALLDIQMPKMNGFDVLKKINELNLPTKVVFLTMHSEEDIFEKAMELGAKAYLLKESVTDDIVQCINNVLQGKFYVSGSISNYLFTLNNKLKTGNEKSGLQKLTSTETKILKLIAEKKSSREIADILYISVRTVENHRNNICTKLDLHGANALLPFALENKHLLV